MRSGAACFEIPSEAIDEADYALPSGVRAWNTSIQDLSPKPLAHGLPRQRPDRLTRCAQTQAARR
jgi:hypothetical protein